MQYIYAQGKFLSEETPFITANDRSFRFGDGVFETILVVGGKMYDSDCHYARLKNGLEYFRIHLDISGLREICEELIQKNDCNEGYVRIIASRGSNGAGAIGYLPGETEPYFVVQTVKKPFPQFQTLKLWVSSYRAHLHLPSKVNNAMLYTMSMIEARDNHCENALILNGENVICETATGSIFWIKNGTLHTPELSLPLVPGTIRKRILTLSKLPVREGRYFLEEIKDADEVFMTNIGLLVSSISSIAPIGFSAKSAKHTKEFRAALEEDIKMNLQCSPA
jgi:branched-chain amino acid aminotransferase